MRGIATALAAEGFHIEMPLLPGHGTVVDDMLPTRWADWAGEAEAAYQRLSQRVANVVVVGLSMGGALTLRVGADHADIAGLVCINPVTQPQIAEIIEMLRGLADGGTGCFPGSIATSPIPTPSRMPTTAPRSSRCCRCCSTGSNRSATSTRRCGCRCC